MLDPRWMSLRVNALNPDGRPLRVPEQRNLFGGLDLGLSGSANRRGPKRSRRIDVDSRWKVGCAAALAVVVEHGKSADAAQAPAEARCPWCGLVGPTDTHFRIRMLQGHREPQSWCRKCRGRYLEPQSCGKGGVFDLDMVIGEPDGISRF